MPRELGVVKSSAQIENDYTEQDDDGRYRLLELRNTHRQFGRFNRPNLWYPLYISPRDGRVTTENEADFIEVYPQWSDGFEGCWTWGKDTAIRDRHLLVGKRIKNEWKVFRKAYSVDSQGNPATKKLNTTWTDSAFHTERGQREFDELMPARIFPAPKPTALIKLACQLATEEEDIVLDFFAGSGTTAQAILNLNREDNGNRRFIMVQLPEPTSEDSDARKAGFATIADIGKERIRRALAKLRRADEGTLPLSTREAPEDLGFRVFKLAPSHLRQWRGVRTTDGAAYIQELSLFANPLDPATQTINAIWEVALREGYSLTARIEGVPAVAAQTVYRVSDPDKGQSFAICLDDALRLDALRPLRLAKDDLFVCRDSALDDSAAANLALQCRLKTI